MSKERAFSIAKAHIDSTYSQSSHEMAIIDDACVELPYGWFVVYNTEQYNTTRDTNLTMVGIRPFLVDTEREAIVGLPGYTLESNQTFLKAYSRIRWILLVPQRIKQWLQAIR
jgi:hypothetical protein